MPAPVHAPPAASGVAAAAPERPADGPVPSPCVNVCRLDPDTGLCIGCRRTIDEIAAWSRMDDRQKREVWARLSQRPAFPQPDDR